MAPTNKRIHIDAKETPVTEGPAQIARLRLIDGKTRVRMTRVIVYEGEANHLGAMLTSPGAFLQPGEPAKCGSREVFRQIKVIV